MIKKYNYLIRSLTIEALKYRRTFALSLAVFAPAFLSVIVFLVYFFKAEQIVDEGVNGWRHMIEYSLNFSTGLLFPLFVILLVVFIHNLEHKVSGQRLFKLLPVHTTTSYISKLLITTGLFLLSILLFMLFINIAALINSYKHPDLFIFDSTLLHYLIKKSSYIFLCSIFMYSIQYFVSLRFSNIIIPIGIGFSGFISAMILMQGWEYIDFHPYALYLLTMGDTTDQQVLNQLLLYSLSGGLIFFTLGYFQLKRKKLFN